MGQIEISFIDKKTGLPYSLPKPRKLIVNGPATIVLWSDGTKTVAKCNTDERFDPEKGVAIAIAKRFVSGNKLHRMFDDAGFQLVDNLGMKSLLEQWAETMAAIANAYGSGARGGKK